MAHERAVLSLRKEDSVVWGALWMVYTTAHMVFTTASEIDVCRVSAEGLRSLFTFT
jgi:hypothetical protein